jgi:8-oxo-dGTP pyrophosphatase MutT (NUDIX family)
MLHLIPASLHRRALRLAHRIRLAWWRIRKPQLDGCRVLAFDDKGRVLLVRHAYGSGRWMLPGGGLRRGEDALGAATREFAEEAGSTLEAARLFGRVDEPLSGANNRVHLVTGWIAGAPRPDGREIVELGLFVAEALPPNLSAALERSITGWVAQARAALEG